MQIELEQGNWTGPIVTQIMVPSSLRLLWHMF